MKPFLPKAGGAVEQGIANEPGVIRRLLAYVKEMSNDKFQIQKVQSLASSCAEIASFALARQIRFFLL